MRKFLILIFVVALVGVGLLPPITSKMGDHALKTIERKPSQELLKKVVQIKMYMYMFAHARPYAEKAIIYCPESEYVDSFIYSAAICAEKEGKNEVAMYWYGRFIKLFDGTGHMWLDQAKNHYSKLYALDE